MLVSRAACRISGSLLTCRVFALLPPSSTSPAPCCAIRGERLCADLGERACASAGERDWANAGERPESGFSSIITMSSSSSSELGGSKEPSP